MPSNTNDETSPLLARPLSSLSEQDNANNAPSAKSKRLLRPIIVCVLLLQFFSMFGYYHILAPKLRSLELLVCRAHYKVHRPGVIKDSPSWPGYDIDERECKVPEVQQRISDLRAWGIFFDGIITLLLSIPYGFLADKYGRKLAYILCVAGLVLSNTWFVLVCTYYDTFDTTAVLGSSIFLVIGGGGYVVTAIVSTMAVDVTDNETRSTMLYWALSAYYLGYVCGTGLSSVTMQTPWLPYFLTFLSFCCGIAVACFMPSTEKKTSIVDTNTRISESPESSLRDIIKREDKLADLIVFAKSQLCRAAEYVTTHRKLVVLILLFPVMATRGPLIELVLPYVSKRYNWPISRVALLDALSGSVGLILGLAILPAVAEILRRRNYSPVHADCLVARYSASALCIASLIIGLAPNIGIMITGWAIFSTGFGIRMSILAMATSMVDSKWAGRLNAVVITTEVLADLTVGPLIWKAWSTALGIGGRSLGLPFFIVSVAMLLVTAVVMSLRFDSQTIDQEEEGQH